MADHKIKLMLTVRAEPDLGTIEYKVGDTFTFTPDSGTLNALCSVPMVPTLGFTPMNGASFTTYALPKEPLFCACGLKLPDGTSVGWPQDPNAGSQTNGGN